jgi:nucleoside-diphosphate-sugar epimerase
MAENRRVFVTGGGSYLGRYVVRALVDEGADVTALIRPNLMDRWALEGVSVAPGDVWNKGSIAGRAREYDAVIHMVGGTRVDPGRGLTYRELNFISARNVIGMAMECGVPRFVLLSASGGLFQRGEYIASRRQAEAYLRKTNLEWVIVRAPALYGDGRTANPLITLMHLIGAVPVLRLLVSRSEALRVDVAARGLARIALDRRVREKIVYSHDLKRRNAPHERARIGSGGVLSARVPAEMDREGLDEIPSGWLPPPPRR